MSSNSGSKMLAISPPASGASRRLRSPPGHRVAAGVAGGHRDLAPVADLAEQRVVRDLDAVEAERRGVGGSKSELAVDLLRGEPLAFGRDEEAADPAVRLGGIRLREDQRHLSDVAERDPHLLAADAPTAIDLLRAGSHRRRVRAGLRLAQREAAERLAGAEARQPPPLLLPRSPALDRSADTRGLPRDPGPARGMPPPDP